MSVQSEFAPTDAPMAKMLFVILIIGQALMVIGFICLIAMAAIMLIPSDFRRASLQTSQIVLRPQP